MIKIPISELKTFLGRASSIKTETLMPISAYVRIKGEANKVTIYKANQTSFLIHSFDYENETEFDFLVEEKSLSIAIDYASSPDCIFEEINGSIKITIGKYEQTSSSEDLKSFYKFPEFSDVFTYEMGGEVLNAINAASKYAHSGKEFVSNLSFVHVVNNYVCATDNKKSYYKKFDEPLPKLTLNLNTCAILSRFASVEVQDINTHYVFSIGSSIYGFLKDLYEAPNFQKAHDTIKEIKRAGFSANKESIYTFADKSFKLSNGFLDVIEVSDLEGGNIKLEFKSDAVKSYTSTELEVKKDAKYSEQSTFLVSAATLKQVLSSLSKETIDICFASHGPANFMIFSEEQNHLSFIMGMTAQ